MTGTLSVLVGSQTQSFIDYLSGTTCSMNKGIGSADKLIMALRGEEKDRKRHRETATRRLRDRKKKTDTSVYLLLNFSSDPLTLSLHIMKVHCTPHHK